MFQKSVPRKLYNGHPLEQTSQISIQKFQRSSGMAALWNKQVKFQSRSSKGVAEWLLFGTNKSKINSEVPKELQNGHSLEQTSQISIQKFQRSCGIDTLWSSPSYFSIESNHINYIVTDRTYCTFTLLIQLPKGDKK